ncbi:MAG: formate/nitrite transporter family protein [Coriobacteriales bacterium]|nr:formate/nitrite transporter family protein [Coriobacteriales bacterium]
MDDKGETSARPDALSAAEVLEKLEYFLPMGLLMKATDFSYVSAVEVGDLNLVVAFMSLAAVTIGNIVGGAVFVSVTYWLAFHRGKANTAVQRPS